MTKDEVTLFFLLYRALGDGLTAQSFKYICESMMAEATAFDKKMYVAELSRPQ
jgi:hypothetical protein